MNSSISILCFGLLCLFCWSNLIQGEPVLDCCLKVSHVEIPKRIVKSYENQVKGQGCDIDATVFTTRRNIKLCAPTEPSWVKALMATVDSKLKRCQQKNFQPKWCHGLQE
ncbi:hypothetical protein GJAV_G00027800 [Gymnothorax javanicus]|nr:hypothetical protein GJAV_G00027800 [Gymnothorax javanicus]